MLAETGFVTHMGPSVEGDCTPFPSYGWNPEELRDNNEKVDYVMLKSVPAELTPGGRAVVQAEYNMASVPAGTISAALMRKVCVRVCVFACVSPPPPPTHTK